MKPNFLFIGPSKSGSSWLHWVLSQHPQAYVPAVKDLYFFDRFHSRSQAWYLKYFADAHPEHLAIGELSHEYLYSPEAAWRIRSMLPNAKLTIILRDPVKRSFSHYLFLKRSGLTKLLFWEAVEQHPKILTDSFYGHHLSLYCQLFPSEQLGIFNFDDIKRPQQLATAICNFLGIDEPIYPTDQKILAAAQARNYRLSKMVKLGAGMARNMGLENLVGSLKFNKRLTGLLFKDYSPSDRPELDPDDEKRLREIFRPDGNRLREMFPNQMWLKRHYPD